MSMYDGPIPEHVAMGCIAAIVVLGLLGYALLKVLGW